MYFLERMASKFLVWRLKKGYGANCRTSDLDDFKRMYTRRGTKLSEAVTHSGRCASCQAKETILFLENHIDLLEM